MKNFLNNLKNRKLFSFLVALLITPVLFYFSLTFSSENLIKQQGNFQLHFIKKCMIYHQPKNLSEIDKSMNICAQNIRNLGPLGDVFLYEPKTKMVIWDASSDCKLNPNNSYLTEENICSLFKDPKSCLIGSRVMNDPYGSFQWNFDEDTEMIVFNSLNLNGEDYRIAIGGKNKDVFELITPLITFFIFLWLIILFGAV